MLRESVSVLIIGRVPLLKYSTPIFDNLIFIVRRDTKLLRKWNRLCKREFGICAARAASWVIRRFPSPFGGVRFLGSPLDVRLPTW